MLPLHLHAIWVEKLSMAVEPLFLIEPVRVVVVSVA